MKALALVGSYHKDGSTNMLVDEVLEAAESAGAKTEKIFLTDLEIEHCRNCQSCWERPELKIGKCPIEDDVEGVLRKIIRCDSMVLATPINYGFPTAVTKSFLERMGPLCKRRGKGPGFISQVPTSRLGKDEGPTKGVMIVTCYGSSFWKLPFGDAEPGFRMLANMLKMANVTDIERVSGAWQMGGLLPLEKRPLLAAKIQRVGTDLARK